MFFAFCIFYAAMSQINYDENKVPSFDLPSVLQFENGSAVKSPDDWTKRRAEILSLFETHVYGKAPVGVPVTKYEVISNDKNAFSGKATRKEVKIIFPEKKSIDVLIYVPNAVQKPATFFIGLNFDGNYTVSNDTGIMLPYFWDSQKQIYRMGTDEERGKKSSDWNVEKIIEAGFGFVTANYCDIAPDSPKEFENGVRLLFEKSDSPENWAAIATWAWGLSRILDYCEKEPLLNAKKAIVFGHSRLGKTALWASATDERFAAAISNNSGCGGAALSRREFGETIRKMNEAFPHWLCENAKQYGENINACPVDQHQLIALSAPRPVYIASAQEDRWADPKGEFLAALYAEPVYLLLGTNGFGGTKEMPEINSPVGDVIRYHIRNGIHRVWPYDWEQYFRFAEENVGK